MGTFDPPTETDKKEATSQCPESYRRRSASKTCAILHRAWTLVAALYVRLVVYPLVAGAPGDMIFHQAGSGPSRSVEIPPGPAHLASRAPLSLRLYGTQKLLALGWPFAFRGQPSLVDPFTPPLARSSAVALLGSQSTLRRVRLPLCPRPPLAALVLACDRPGRHTVPARLQRYSSSPAYLGPLDLRTPGAAVDAPRRAYTWCTSAVPLSPHVPAHRTFPLAARQRALLISFRLPPGPAAALPCPTRFHSAACPFRSASPPRCYASCWRHPLASLAFPVLGPLRPTSACSLTLHLTSL
ncbi:hypothetical protein FB451DRAFT_1395540 [Mycena latifolia]|nr:hypothetical protein FB451DRAFT_1395540 [Mycena latifolia]